MTEGLEASKAYIRGEAKESIVSFLKSRLNRDGGFTGRGGGSDLYYTVFGIECLLALTGSLPIRKLESYVGSFGDGDGLDFVHLTCLARCRSHLPRMITAMEQEQRMLMRLEGYRSDDGGYHAREASPCASAYACFLAFLSYEGFETAIPAPRDLVRSLQNLRTPDGSFANEPGVGKGSVAATAAASILQVHLGDPVGQGVEDWLLARCDPRGGLLATRDAPGPDLLSTATALQALSAMDADMDAIRAPCVDFVESLWDDSGGFCGHAADPTPDCEYTFYGLLALGNLFKKSPSAPSDTPELAL